MKLNMAKTPYKNLHAHHNLFTFNSQIFNILERISIGNDYW